MSLLFILFLLCFLVVLFFYLVQLLLYYLAISFFKKTFKTEKGQKLFSFKSVTLDANFSNLCAENVHFSIDIRGLISTKYKFFNLQIESMKIQTLTETKSLFERPPHTVRENIGIQVYVHILAMIVKRIQIDINKFVFTKTKYIITCQDLSLKWSKSFSYAFQLHIPKSQINIINHFSIDFDPIIFSPYFGIDPFLSLINLEALLLPFEFQISSLKFFIHQHELKLKPINVSFVLPRGNITLTTPDIRGTMDINVPDFNIKINDVSGFLSRPLIKIPHLVLNVSILSIKELKISHENRPILNINEFSYSQKENEPRNIYYKSAEMFYHTKIMANLLPFFHDHLFVILLPISKNDNREPSITDCNLLADQFIFIVKITDNTSLKIDLSKFQIKNNEVKLPEVTGYVNGQKVLSVKKVKIFINKDKFFQAKAKSFHLHDRPGMFFENAITEIKLSCHMIASYLFSFNPNEESLKFPFILTFDTFKIKFHDTDLNQSIARASQILPKINRECMIRQFLLSKKKTEMKLDRDTVKEAEFRLSKLAFREYREKFEKQKLHRYSYHFVVEKCSFSFDSRNFNEKIKMIHQIDPTTKLLYSEIDWDLMLGFNFEFKAQTFKVFAFDIEEPIINVDSMNLKGPTIIACPASKDLANGQFIIDNEVIPLRLNPLNMILYTDMLIAADNFHFYYGFAFQSVYQEMTIRLYSLLPKTIDPSPRFAWFDLLRACFRGQFIFKADRFEWRIPATGSFRETDNYMPIRIEKFHLLCKEGEFALNADMLKTPRIYNGKEGPSVFEVPKFTATVRFNWESEKVDNDCLQRRFIVLPDVNSFSVDGYDTYKYFRAKKISIDDLTIFLSKTESIVPTMTVDVAHLNWLIQPITYSLSRRHIKNRIAKKLGFRELQKPPYAKYFIELEMTSHVKIIGDTFVIRIFDHFPINGCVQGSSIDFTFRSFTGYSDIEHENLSNSKFKCESLSLNATDLSYYTYGGIRTRSPTILIMKPFCLEYSKEAVIKVDEVLLHFNQLLFKYLMDFVTSINFKLKITGRQNRLKMTLDDFPIRTASIAVKCGKVFLTSLESDLQIVLVLDSVGFDLLTNNKKQGAHHLKIASIAMLLNGKVKHHRKHGHRHRRKAKTDISDSTDGNESTEIDISSNDNDNDNTEISSEISDMNDNTENIEKSDNAFNSFLTVSDVSIFYSQQNMINSFGKLVISATTNDVSIIKYLWNEFRNDSDQPSSPNHVSHGSITEFEMSSTLPSIKITLTIGDDIAEVNFDDVTAVLKKTLNKTNEAMLMIMNATIKNLSKDAPFPEALLKWNEQSIAKANRPHIQILLKIPPKIKYAHIFSQAEVNMEPSIVNYDAKFWESFMVLINARFEKKPPKSHNQFIITTGYGNQMPFVVYDKSLFPATSKHDSEDYSTNKTIHVKKANHDEHIILMFRYLRINPILMNVTYRNSDNKILSEINNFQGQMHEIIYHDLTTTVENLVSKIMYDVAKDILPQFLKHVVGFKKQGATPEQEMEEWLNSEDKRMSKEDKQKMLLFGSRTLKKK